MTVPRNSPQSDIIREADRLIALATEAVEAGEITTEDDATIVGDLLRSLNAVAKEAKAARKAEVEPLNLQVEAINAEWRPITERIEAARTAIKALAAGWLKRKYDEAREATDRLRARVQEERRKAEISAAATTVAEAVLDAPTGLVEAEAALRKAEAAPVHIGSQAGGRRALALKAGPWRIETSTDRALVAWCWQHRHPALLDAAVEIVLAAKRAEPELVVDGVTFTREQTLA